MSVQEGDFILVDLTGMATEEVFDTTLEQIARDEGIFEEGRKYEPRMVIVGEGVILKRLEEGLIGMEVGDKEEVDIPPDEGFGERKPDWVQTMPFRTLRSMGILPKVGGQIEVEGRAAIVRSINSGRVLLDYNHPLAGRVITYKVHIIERYDSDEAKIRAIMGRYFTREDSKDLKVRFLKNRVRITIPNRMFHAENLQVAKLQTANQIRRHLGFEKVEYLEVVEAIKRA